MSGRGAAQPRCFRLFPGPRPASLGLGCPRSGGESHVAGEEKGRRDPARARGREAPGYGPDLRCPPGRAAGLLIARPAPAVAPGRPLPARPSSGERRWPGHSLPSGGLRPNWITPLCTSGQSSASISLPVHWERASYLALYVGYHTYKGLVPVCLSMRKTPSRLGVSVFPFIK